MRLGRWNALATGAAMAAMLVTVAGPVAAISPAAPSPAVVPETGAFILRSLQGKGLVTLTQAGSTATLRFQLMGLKKQSPYRLVGSTKGCASTKGVLFNRAFTSNAKGSWWDPTTYQIDAHKVVSVRLINKATGAKVACADSAQIPMTPAAAATKLSSGTIRGLVVTSETIDSPKTVIATFTGLAPDTGYVLVGRTGTCGAPDANAWVRSVSANASGNAFELYFASTNVVATIVDVSLDAAPDEDPPLVCRQIR